MKTRYLTAACIIVESDEAKVLFDPWFSETAFHGAWAHDPPIEPRWDEVRDVTAIVVSHLHHDHMDIATLRKLPRVPVYIPKFERLPMARILRQEGLDVHECPWWEPVHHGDLRLRPLRPTGPELDSAWSIEQDRKTILNLVDTDAGALTDIVSWCDGRPIAEMWMQYAASGPYPHAFTDLTDHQKSSRAQELMIRKLNEFRSAAATFRAVVAYPFAVGYRLRGRLDWMNPCRPIPERQELKDRLRAGPHVIPEEDWATTRPRERFELLDWELDEWDSDQRTLADLEEALAEWPARAKANGETVPPKWSLWFNLYADSHPYRTSGLNSEYDHDFNLDERQLRWLLTRRMHWDNALGSSQILMSRQGPFDRSLYRAMSYLHL